MTTSRHVHPRTLFILLLFAWLHVLCARSIAAERPHIVFVLADDMGIGDTSSYGGKIAATPQLERMAREGTRFTQFYAASPICSPSRCGLITGQFPARWNITSYMQTREGNRQCEQVDFLDPNAPSLPRVLQAAGYATAHIGKWHLGGGRDVVSPPKFAAYGYDAGLGTYESPEPAAALGLKTVPWGNELEPQQVPLRRSQREDSHAAIREIQGRDRWKFRINPPPAPQPEQTIRRTPRPPVAAAARSVCGSR